MKFIQSVIDKALELGAQKCGSVEVEHITFDAGLRKNCEMNYCGSYGKNYMCPPDAGEIHELIQQAKEYGHLILFQTISSLEDSFDIEGMQEAAERHANLVDNLSDYLCALPGAPRYLILGAGGCHLCQPCGKVTGDPCRHPDRAHASLETYGIFVAKLAEQCGMQYINGQNTVTYFGAVLFSE